MGAERHVPIDGHRVGVHDLDAGVGGDRLAEGSHQAPVELHREHPRPRRRQGDGEGAEAGADLEYAIAGRDARIRDDGSGQVGVREEVLTQRAGGGDAVSGGECLQRPQAEPGVTR